MAFSHIFEFIYGAPDETDGHPFGRVYGDFRREHHHDIPAFAGDPRLVLAEFTVPFDVRDCPDEYAERKRCVMQYAEELYPMLRKRIVEADDPNPVLSHLDSLLIVVAEEQ